MLITWAVLGVLGETGFPIALRHILSLLAWASKPGGPAKAAYVHMLTRSHVYYNLLFNRSLTIVLAYLLTAIQVLSTTTFLAIEFNNVSCRCRCCWAGHGGLAGMGSLDRSI